MRTKSSVRLPLILLGACAMCGASASAAPLPPQNSASRTLVANLGLVPPAARDFALGAEPDLFTGSLKRKLDLPLPPGRLVPSLALEYASGGAAGWLGLGWDLELGAVERRARKGVDHAADDYVLRGGPSDELVAIGGGEYRAKLEGGFARVRKLTANDGRPYWEVTDRGGLRRTYGTTAAARQDDPANPARIFRWCLDRIEDPSGNFVTITYVKDRGAVYPDVLSYAGGPGLSPSVSVRFWRDTALRSDAAPDYRVGFGVVTAYLLRSIEVRAAGSVDRVFALDYGYSGASGRAQLRAVTRYGSDATVGLNGVVTAGSALPARSFGYTVGTPPDNTTTAGPSVSAMVSGVNVVNPDLSRLIYADFNGDGRTDIAYVDGFGTSRPIKIFIANGAGFNAPVDGPVRSVGNTTSAILNDVARVKVGDFNGDGRADLLTIDGATGSGTVGVYLATAAGTFPTQRSFSGPTVQVGTPDVDVSRIVLGDFNGDARTDLLHVPGTTVASPIRLYLSTGAGFGPALNGPSFAVLAGVSSLARVKAGDFDGDTRTDLALVNGSGGAAAMTFYRLNAAGTTLEFFMNGPVRTIRADAEGARIDASRVMAADVNGDDKTDILALEGWGTTAPMSVYLATGSGFTARLDGPSRFFSSTYPDQSLGRIRIGDFNGDARADLAFVEGDNGSAPISIYLSAGDRYQSALAGPTRAISGGTALAQELLRVGIGDFDGDGRADFAGNNSSGTSVPMSIYLARGAYPDQLGTEANGIGASVAISYLSSSAYSNVQLPFPVQTVQGVTTGDGNGILATTSYGYSGGYYHLVEREFRGFNRVDVTAPAGPSGEQSQTRYWFHQGNDAAVDSNDPSGTLGCTKGKAYRMQAWDLQASTFVETTTAYWAANSAPCFTPPYEVKTRNCEQTTGGTTCGRTRTVSLATFSAGQPAFGYDAYGNVLQENDYGDDSTAADDRTTVRSYAPNTTAWIVDQPSIETIYAGAGPATSLAPANRLAETTFYYDGTLNAATCASTGASPTPTRGLLTRKLRWLNGGASPEAWTGYDAYGNRICESDPDRRITRFGYDASATFKTSETNAKNHVVRHQYYGVDGVLADTGRFGNVKVVTDPNGIETRYEHDKFGRPTKETKPPVAAPLAGNPFPGFSTTTSYYLGAVGVNRVESLTSEGLWSADYFDGLGRTYSVKQKASTLPGARTFVATAEFNATGTKARVSQPRQDGASPRWTQFTYDGRGRTLRVTEPDGTRKLSCFRDLDGSSVEVDENGHRRRTVRDARDRVVSIQEYQGVVVACAVDAGTPYTTTRYTHDRLDRLTDIIDSMGTPYVVGFDTLGRMRFESDPDLGTWYYGYSPAGDRTMVQDARGVLASPPYSFALGYDELHRVMWKSYPDGTRVDYVHDDPSVPYSKGRLTRVTDSSGWTTFAFDARGRVIRQARAIDGVVYTNGTSYDPADRVVGETYPDASAVAYQYDVDGFLGRVSMGGSDYALLTGYNALGQVGSIASPASSTAFAYNDTGNNRLRSVQVTARGARVLDLAYEYEPNRRIKKLTDGLDPGLTFDFGYDGLSRLTSATSSRYGQLSYSYDTIGNFISKEGVAYTAYDPVKVHAVRTTSDGRSYGYDPNGNMTADGSRTLLYDWENRPTVVTSGSTTSLFTYTAGGERVKRQVKVGTTVTSTSVYVGRLYECTNGVCTKHVFAGDTRIASLEDGGAVRYYHGDHLDSTRVVTDAAGFVLERIAYKPYGDGDSPPTNGTRYRYTSKERDAETGLYFYGARYYDPRLGRFISPDPPQMRPGEPSSLNRYAYVNNNPVRFNDPSGNEGEDPQVPLSPSDYKMPTASEVADRVAASFIGRFVEGQRAELRAQAQMFVSGEIVNPRRMLVGTYDFTLRSLRVGSNTAAGMASDEPLSTTIGVVTDVRDGAALASMLMGVGVALGPKGAPDLPSDALVCRAGTCGRDNFLNGTGVRVGPDGRLYRVSVSAGGTDKELGATFPHKQMGVTKVGQVEAAGGKLTHTPTAANPYHHDLDGLTADQLVELFKDVQRNPNPAPRPDVPR